MTTLTANPREPMAGHPRVDISRPPSVGAIVLDRWKRAAPIPTIVPEKCGMNED